MLDLVIKHRYDDGSEFYVYGDLKEETAYLTITACRMCGRPHELVELLVRDPTQSLPYTVFYRCPQNNTLTVLLKILA